MAIKDQDYHYGMIDSPPAPLFETNWQIAFAALAVRTTAAHAALLSGNQELAAVETTEATKLIQETLQPPPTIGLPTIAEANQKQT